MSKIIFHRFLNNKNRISEYEKTYNIQIQTLKKRLYIKGNKRIIYLNYVLAYINQPLYLYHVS